MSARLALRLSLVLAACVAPVIVLHAQPSAFPAFPAPHSTTNAAVKTPPMPPLKWPVDQFRDLLAMTPVAREQYLTNRPPGIRQRIVEKLAEYETMKPADRELRLRMTELRWYLLALMPIRANERTKQLALVPEADRQLLADRLEQWDRLPLDEQKAVLKYEKTMEQFADQNVAGPAASNLLNRVPPQSRTNNLDKLDDFLKLPPEQRQQMYASFQRFFELTDAEKQKTLGALPDAQRAQTTGTLQTLSRMTPAERAQYLEAVSRFSSMSDTERREFIRNAEKWRQLSPAERQAWRSLVNHVVRKPPLPPGLAFPPLPPGFALQANTTNHTNSTP